METIISQIDPANPDRDIIERAGSIIRGGGIVAFPTETVYGLGGDGLSAESAGRIYAAKGRPSDNPLIVHIAEMDSLARIVREIPDAAYRLAERFWPGPLTMIMNKSEVVPLRITGGLNTVAVRFPSDPVAQALIRASGGYVAAPSANLSGRPSPTCARDVIADMDGRIDMILCGDDSRIGLESTIIDLTDAVPAVLRPGFITDEMLREILPDLRSGSTVQEIVDDSAPKAPGMKYRHYAPQGLMVIVTGAPDNVVSYINERIRSDAAEGYRTGVISSDETADRYEADVCISLGAYGDDETAAHRLFTSLREMDAAGVERIYAQSVDADGLGVAIMNRMIKAAGHNLVHV